MYSHSISTSNACQEGIVTQTIILERSACFSVTGLPNEGQSHMTKGPAAALAIHFFLLYLSLSRCASRGLSTSKRSRQSQLALRHHSARASRPTSPGYHNFSAYHPFLASALPGSRKASWLRIYWPLAPARSSVQLLAATSYNPPGSFNDMRYLLSCCVLA
jgi:hypothetical protein